MGEKGLYNAFCSGEKSSADKKTVMQVADSEKAKQAFYYIRHHGARPLPPMRPRDNIIAKLDQEKTWATPAVVSKEFVTRRSYRLQTPQGTVLRRNRRHLHYDTLPQPSTATPALLAVAGVVVEPPPITQTAPCLTTHNTC